MFITSNKMEKAMADGYNVTVIINGKHYDYKPGTKKKSTFSITVRRWKVDRKKDKYLSPEEKTISGKNAKEAMQRYHDLLDKSDLFSFTKWEIINIKD